MSSWSAENATEAFLNTLKMGKKAKELPDVAEFVSAMAAGNNAQLMVIAYEKSADDKIVALAAAATQTGGRVICIIPTQQDLHLSQPIIINLQSQSQSHHPIQFVVGDFQNLLTTTYYAQVDFLLIDCNLDGHVAVLDAVRSRTNNNNNQRATVVVGFNAMIRSERSVGWHCGGSRTYLLPIGKGLLVTKVAAAEMSKCGGDIGRRRRRSSQWVVKVDKCTGEEHVYRVRLPQGKVIQA